MGQNSIPKHCAFKLAMLCVLLFVSRLMWFLIIRLVRWNFWSALMWQLVELMFLAYLMVRIEKNSYFTCSYNELYKVHGCLTDLCFIRYFWNMTNNPWKEDQKAINSSLLKYVYLMILWFWLGVYLSYNFYLSFDVTNQVVME